MEADRIRPVVHKLVSMLTHGQFEDVIASCTATRLSAMELRDALSEYKMTFIVPPIDAYEGFDIHRLNNLDTPTWSVRAPLWSIEEGRSDLEMQLTVQDLSGSWSIELDSVHVP